MDSEQKRYKIAHLADIHIKDARREEYQYIFTRLYGSLQEHKPDIIALAGDIFDLKTKVSANNITDLSEFLSTLVAIAPVLMIPGNHDINLNIQESPDLLSPIVSIHKNFSPSSLSYWRSSGIHYVHGLIWVAIVPDGPIIANDEVERWAKEKNLTNVPRVCLFHETVDGAQLPSGDHRLNGRRLTLRDLAPYDLSLGGDIHLRQKIGERGAYCGSLIQQNIGEPHHGHGYLLWEIGPSGGASPYRSLPPQKQDIDIYNPRGFLKVTINAGIDATPEPLPTHPNFYNIVYDISTPFDKLQEIAKKYDTKYGPPRVIKLLVEKNVDKRKKRYHRDSPQALCRAQMEASSVQAHEDLIREILGPDCPDINQILDMHRKEFGTYSIFQTEHACKRVRLLNLEFDNLYCYGKGNVVDFTKLEHGLSGLIAKNYSGKSSLIDIIVYALYNATPRTGTAKQNAINKDSNSFYLKLEFELDGKRGVIRRGGGRGRARPEYFFSFDGENLTQGDFNQTYAVIRKYVGTYDAARSIAISHQDHSMDFVKGTSTERRQILTELLALGSFSTIIKNVKKDSLSLKSSIKTLRGSSRGQSEEELLHEKEALIRGIDGRRGELAEKKRILDKLALQLGETLEELGRSRERLGALQAQAVEKDIPMILVSEEEILVSKKTFDDAVAEIGGAGAPWDCDGSGLQNPIPSLTKSCLLLQDELSVLEKKQICMDSVMAKIKENPTSILRGKPTPPKFKRPQGAVPWPMWSNNTRKRFWDKNRVDQAKKSIIDTCERYNINLDACREFIQNKLKRALRQLPAAAIQEDKVPIYEEVLSHLQRDDSIDLPQNFTILDIENLRTLSKEKIKQTQGEARELEISLHEARLFEKNHPSEFRKKAQEFVSESYPNNPILPHDVPIRVLQNALIEARRRVEIAQHVHSLRPSLDLREGCPGCENTEKLFLCGNLERLMAESVVAGKAVEEALYENCVRDAWNRRDIEKLFIEVTRKLRDLELHDQKLTEILVAQKFIKNYQTYSLATKEVDLWERTLEDLDTLEYVAHLWHSRTDIWKKYDDELSAYNRQELIQAERGALQREIDKNTFKQKKILIALEHGNSLKSLYQNKFLQTRHQELLEKMEAQDALTREKEEIRFQLEARLRDFQMTYDALLNQIASLETAIAKVDERIDIERRRYSECSAKERELLILENYLKVLNPTTGIGERLLDRARQDLVKNINQVLCEIGSGLEIQLDASYDFFLLTGEELLPASLGSGYQIFVLNLACRIALFQLAEVPLPDCLIIDEGFGCCDEENLETAAQYLELMAATTDAPRIICIVSHLEKLRNRLAIQLKLETHSGKSKINI